LEKLLLFTNPLTSGHMKMEFILRRMPKLLVDGIEHLTNRLPPGLTNKLATQLAARFRRDENC
jgi:hypothetical protein